MTPSKYGDDFTVGDVYTTAAITITEAHLVNWAGLTMDFYPLHMDREYAAATQFGERLAHGPLIFALSVGLVGAAGFAGDSAIAWLGVDNLRMLAPVRIGDTVKVAVEILEKVATSNPHKGIQVWRYTVTNQRGESVMQHDYRMMFHMRGETTPVATS
ncbi:MAG TPA: MaoC/PaaZ C-terminal domain-containing protein [Xanthomonadales bacterium]|nr:MaoC/PaaZ C-terminal domain-containing protein [Xanthomonadales bacterium]